MTEQILLFLKDSVIERFNPECITYRDFVKIQAGTFLGVDVLDGSYTTNMNKKAILVKFNKHSAISPNEQLNISNLMKGHWRVPFEYTVYELELTNEEKNKTFTGLQLLHDDLSLQLLYDVTERFIDMFGYPPYRYSVKEEALEKMLADPDLHEELENLAACGMANLSNIPFAASILLSAKSIPRIIQLDRKLQPVEKV